jgi:site-specific recombinase XerC
MRDSTPIRDYQARFENYIRLTGSPRTRRRYSYALENFFSLFPHKKKASNFLPADLKYFVSMREREGISKATIKYELAVLRAFWNCLIELGAADYNPVLEFLPTRKRFVEFCEARESPFLVS